MNTDRFRWLGFFPLRRPEGEGAGGDAGSIASGGETPASEGEAKPEGEGSIASGGETQPEGSKLEGEGEGKPKEGEAAPKPEALDPAKLTLPEGMKADDPALRSFLDIVGKTDGTPQERAQGLLDLYKEQVLAAAQAPVDEYKRMQTAWREEIRKDPTLGGDKLPATTAAISKAINAYAGGPEAAQKVRAALDLTGAGNHPDIIRLLYSMASKLTEGGFISGGPGGGGPKTVGDIFYGNSSGAAA